MLTFNIKDVLDNFWISSLRMFRVTCCSDLFMPAHHFSIVLQHNKGSDKVLTKCTALEEKEAQNLEVVAFCEDVAM